jgi:hypothetical protein
MFEFLTRVRAIGCVPFAQAPRQHSAIMHPSCRADVDLDIPAIVVMGWQSAGKSSLVEAISGITLPRASGTCTRCVTQRYQVTIPLLKVSGVRQSANLPTLMLHGRAESLCG